MTRLSSVQALRLKSIKRLVRAQMMRQVFEIENVSAMGMHAEKGRL
jgi:hypothetical protein